MMWGSWGLHWVWMLAFWGVVIALIVWAVARLTPTTTAGRGSREAREILDERYARGELGTDEYRQRRQELDVAAR